MEQEVQQAFLLAEVCVREIILRLKEEKLKKITCWCTWVSQSIKRHSLDLNCLDLLVLSSSPALGSTLGMELT